MADYWNTDWLNRSDMFAPLRFFLFGHALYHKALDTFIGMTGKAVLLGVPGWWTRNEQESFYENAAYFRPGRRSPGAQDQTVSSSV